MSKRETTEITPKALAELQTPCLLLEKAKMQANIDRLKVHIQQRGTTLRPHVKTSKSIDVLRAVLKDAEHQKITVSTLEEARYFASNGILDIMYAVGVTPQKLPEVASFLKQGVQLSIILDDVGMAQKVVAAGLAEGVMYPVYIELDVDGHRSGVTPDDPVLLEIGKILQGTSGAYLKGVMTHAGESYNCGSVDEIADMAEQERALSVHAANRLRAVGISCDEVSVGSSPTAQFARDLTDVTEVRAGVYIFEDLFQAGLKCCTTDDIAISVLATVNAHKRSANKIIVDAGWMAMSRDRGTSSQKTDQGYGLVLDETGVSIGDLVMVSANQEHGVIAERSGKALPFDKLPIGSRVRILPNHACSTSAQYDEYKIIEGLKVVAAWPRIRGW